MVAQPGKTVRLRYGNNPTLCAFTGSRQHRADFNGMVAIIVDDRNDAITAIYFADFGKPAFDATEFVKAMRNRRIAHPHFKANSDSGQRILHIMAAWHGKPNILYRPQ
jgi:hypothetical protein